MMNRDFKHFSHLTMSYLGDMALMNGTLTSPHPVPSLRGSGEGENPCASGQNRQDWTQEMLNRFPERRRFWLKETRRPLS